MTNTSKITSATVLALMADASHSIKDMRAAVQAALLGLVEHAHEHGDKRMLINDAPGWIKDMNGVNMTAIVEWCTKFGGVAIGDGGFVNVKDQRVDMAGAIGCDWWTLKPVSPFKGMDLTADLDKLLKKVVNCNKAANESGEHDKVYAPDEAVAGIASIHAGLVAIRESDERQKRLKDAQDDLAAHDEEAAPADASEAPSASGDDLEDLPAVEAA